MANVEKEKQDEGIRGFAPIIAALEEGALHADASEQLRELHLKCARHAAMYGKGKGTLTLKINLAAERGGIVDVTGEVTIKAPKPVRSKTVMWGTEGGNLSTKNPKQQELALQAVPRPKHAEAPDEPKPKPVSV